MSSLRRVVPGRVGGSGTRTGCPRYVVGLTAMLLALSFAVVNVFLKILKILLALVGIVLAVWLTWATRLSNADQVLLGDGGVYFVDQDCYSRMMRAFAPGLEALPPGMTAAQFENWPAGVEQHTTFPMDGAIRLVNLFAPGPELAGAWVSPILALVALAFLMFWAGALKLRDGWMTPGLFAISPILAMGTIFGRPDHQSLLILFLTIAIGAEIAILRRCTLADDEKRGPGWGWQITGGLAWGCALWTSLYEPVILLVLVLALNLAMFRDSLRWSRRKGFVIALAPLLLITLVEAWPISLPGSGPGQEHFANWSRIIPELQGYGLSLVFGGVRAGGGSLVDWVGWGVFLAPWLFIVSWMLRRNRLVLWTALFTLAVVLLAMWQIRWAFYAVLIYGFSLPWQMRALPRGWMAGLLFVLPLLWPVGAHWDRLLYPEPALKAQQEQQTLDQQLTRQMALAIREQSGLETRDQGILAPWWMSPSLAFWSGQPAVAGSSHQSLPGIADTFRFYRTTDPAVAAQILRERQVRWVIAEDPQRVLPMALSFFAETPAPETGQPPARPGAGVQESITIDGQPQPLLVQPDATMAARLYAGRDIPPYLRLAGDFQYFQLYQVNPEGLPVEE